MKPMFTAVDDDAELIGLGVSCRYHKNHIITSVDWSGRTYYCGASPSGKQFCGHSFPKKWFRLEITQGD